MILDHVHNWRKYAACHSAFPKAFAYLAETDFARLEPGRYDIDGDRIYAMVQDCEGRGREGARFEAHRRYIDIQFTHTGAEQIGWSDLGWPSLKAEGYSEEKDVEFLAGQGMAWVDVVAGSFAVFFPHDAHAPLAGTGAFRKVVVKVAVE